MIVTVQHPTYGSICYEESAWSGKKKLIVNGFVLEKSQKNVYLLYTDRGTEVVNLRGSYLTGVTLDIRGEHIVLVPAPKWYEVICSVFMVIFFIAWGNSIALCSIIPIVGGAIGGGISAVMAMLNLMCMKKMDTGLKKLLVFVGMFVGTFFLLFLLALFIVGLLA